MIASFSDDLGISRELALKMAGAFGGGIANQGETCGAVTGAMMALGMKYGKIKADDQEANEKVANLGLEFLKQFRERHGTLRCKELLGCDISTPEGMAKAKERDVGNNVCVEFVRNGAEIMDRILKQQVV